jgi:hypothetical protein
MGKHRSCGHQASGVTGINLGYRIRVTANDHKRGWAAIATKSGQEPESELETPVVIEHSAGCSQFATGRAGEEHPCA